MNRRLVKYGTVRVRLGEVVDDRGVDEASRDASEAEVVRDGSMTAAVVRCRRQGVDAVDCGGVDVVVDDAADGVDTAGHRDYQIADTVTC